MRDALRARLAATLAASTLITLSSLSAVARADEPRGLLGRFLRFGNRTNTPPPAARSEKPKPSNPAPTVPDVGAPAPKPSRPDLSNPYTGLNPYGGNGLYGAGAGNNPTPKPARPSLNDGYNPLLNPPNFPESSTPPSSGTSSGQPRIIPQPRVSRAVTEADPILTRVSLGRSDDGRQFGMFLQVFADGTVIDTEGVHRVGGDTLHPLLEALRAADVGRLRGHCGGPPTDFVEQVHLVVFDRSRGRLQANHFSYSGNPQGCDPAIRNLQAAIDALQMKITTPSPVPSATSTPPTDALAPPAPELNTPNASPGPQPNNDPAPIPLSIID